MAQSRILKLIGENISKIRGFKNLSQSDLAKKMKVDPSYISSLEKGMRNPSVGTLEKVALALNSSAIELLQSSARREASKGMSYVSGLIEKKASDWKSKEWYHQRFDGAPYLIHMIAEAQITVDRAKKGLTSFGKNFCFFEEGKADWYMDINEINQITNEVINRGKSDPDVGRTFLLEWEAVDKEFYDTCEEIQGLSLRKLSDQELINLHDDYLDLILRRNSSSSIIDGFALGSDRKLEASLKELYTKSKISKSIKFPELFSKLTAPLHTSFIRQAEIDLYNLILRTRKTPKNKRKFLQEYRDSYFWLRNNYVDAYDLSLDYFEDEFNKVEAAHSDIEHEISKLSGEAAEHAHQKSMLLKQMNVDKETKLLLDVTEAFTQWQDERKKATLFTAHYGMLILKEISQRIDIPLELLKYMIPREVSNIFLQTPTLNELKARQAGCVIYWDQDGFEVITGTKVGSIKMSLFGKKELADVKDFRGLTASLGKTQGRVRILKSAKEIGNLKQGEILVAVMTRPDYVPAMKKASAIVTDEGGITSHAAIVSRELKIPCIIGTKIATQVLKDGDLVEVNANHGVVRILERIEREK